MAASATVAEASIATAAAARTITPMNTLRTRSAETEELRGGLGAWRASVAARAAGAASAESDPYNSFTTGRWRARTSASAQQD